MKAIVKRNIPNLLTCVRIVLSPFLLIFNDFEVDFFIIYSICGLTDVLDGFLARKLNVTSKFGEVLDSISDFVFLIVVGVMVIPLFKWDYLKIVFILIIFLIKISSLIIGKIKFRSFSWIHTYLNKFMGICLFIFVYFINLLSLNWIFFILSSIAILSAVEELIILLTQKELNRNQKSLFFN